MNKWTVLLILALVSLGCQELKNEDENQHEMTRNIDVQGHRGCRGLMPENSIAAFIKALEIGVTTLELDVVISRDSQVLVSHEPWLSSILCKSPTGEDIPENSEQDWNLYQMNYEEIRNCDCGQRRHPRFPDQTLMHTYKPLLKEVFEKVEAYLKEKDLTPVHYNIETKSDPSSDGIFHPAPEAFTRLLLEVIEENRLESRVLIQSFDPRTLQVAKKMAPEISLVLLVEGDKDPVARLDELGFVPNVYSPEHVLVTDSLRAWTSEKGMKLIPWTVNEPTDMKHLIELGVDGIITDYPDRLVGLLNSL